MLCKSLHRKQRGLTFIELMVSIAVLIIISGLVTNLGPTMNFRARIETENRLKDLRNAVETAYREHAATVDASENAEMDLGTLGKLSPTANTAGAVCAATATTFQPIARYGTRAASDMAEDGHHRPLCLFINPRASSVIDGVTVFYHSVAIVSAGTNGKLDTGTTLDADGNLVLGGDDKGLLFDGRKFALDRYRLTMDNLRKTADALRLYFRARYEGDPSRSTSVDYFGCGAEACPPATANPRWDAGNELPTTCLGAVSMVAATGTSIHTFLGLTQADVTDGYGTVFEFDNCVDTVRSPNNTTTTMQSPPYTAMVSTTLPGGDVLATSVVGEF